MPLSEFKKGLFVHVKITSSTVSTYWIMYHILQDLLWVIQGQELWHNFDESLFAQSYRYPLGMKEKINLFSYSFLGNNEITIKSQNV
jgi:hypothetical protein